MTRKFFGLLAAAVLAVAATAETVQEMKPYETNVEWNGFWSTTGRVDTVVNVASSASMADFGAAETHSVFAALADFDARTQTTDHDPFDVTINVLKQWGMLLFLK